MFIWYVYIQSLQRPLDTQKTRQSNTEAKNGQKRRQTRQAFQCESPDVPFTLWFSRYRMGQKISPKAIKNAYMYAAFFSTAPVCFATSKELNVITSRMASVLFSKLLLSLAFLLNRTLKQISKFVTDDLLAAMLFCLLSRSFYASLFLPMAKIFLSQRNTPFRCETNVSENVHEITFEILSS